jgi:hypothetical protein
METFIFIWIQFMIKGIIDISLHYNNKCLKQYFSIKHIRRLKWNGFDGIEHQIHYYIPFCAIMEAKGAIILLFIWIQFRIWMEQLRFRYIFHSKVCLKTIENSKRLKWNGFDGIEHQIQLPFRAIMGTKGTINLINDSIENMRGIIDIS